MNGVFWLRNIAVSVVAMLAWFGCARAGINPVQITAAMAAIYLLMVAFGAVTEKEPGTIIVTALTLAVIAIAVNYYLGFMPFIVLAAFIYGWSNVEMVYDPVHPSFRTFVALPCVTAFIVVSFAGPAWMIAAALLLAIVQALVLYRPSRIRPA